jgi:Pyruvate/2-oxoacid:ferredoxin oxidoreductase delta subunit
VREVYQRLAEFLDTFPQRYPLNTESGIELRVLEHIFTPEEAEMTMKLQMKPERAAEIAERIGADPDQTEKTLYDMSAKGQILRLGKDGKYKYMPMAFFVGIYEFQLGHLTREFAQLMEEFKPILAENTWLKGETRELRTVPVNQTVEARSEVLSYESAEELIQSSAKISIQECICRKEKRLVDEPCHHPVNNCFSFGNMTDYWVEAGEGRRVDQDEALRILQESVESGLVIQMASSQNPGGMCLCCGCCCLPLSVYKGMENPAAVANSSFYAVVDADECIACGTCVDRCHVDAITVDDTAHIDLDRCIGCGVCAVTCDVDAISLRRKADPFVPKEDYRSTMKDIYQERRRS